MKKKTVLLTFEWDEQNELLEIHGNQEGLNSFKNEIELLLKSTNEDHIHLQSPSWGGQELSDKKLNEQNKLISNVKIFKWISKD